LAQNQRRLRNVCLAQRDMTFKDIFKVVSSLLGGKTRQEEEN
jgi:hypothetical protein